MNICSGTWGEAKAEKQKGSRKIQQVGECKLEAVSIKKSIKTLPCPSAASEYIRVH